MAKRTKPTTIHHAKVSKRQPKSAIKSTKRAHPRKTTKTVQSPLINALWIVASLVVMATVIIVFQRQPITSHANISSVQKKQPQLAKKAAVRPPANPTTTLVALNAATSCPNGTVLNVVAHEDDDILFMNPDLQQAIAAGECVRTVYVTAGDDGHDSTYWQERELGPEAAYAAMAGISNAWVTSSVLIKNHTVSVHQPTEDPKISLVFMRLPDGGPSGKGYPRDNNESLLKLQSGEIPVIHSVDGTSTYTELQLIETLRTIMNVDHPTLINTQAFSPELAKGDHPDHQAVGYITSLAKFSYLGSTQLHRYIGYEIGTMPVNLTDTQTASKQSIFSAYEGYDKMICNEGCFNNFIYTRYLGREYQQSNSDN